MRMLRAVAVGLAFSLGSLPSWGQSVVAVSPDITVDLAGATTHDEDVAADNQLGVVATENLGSLPPEADVSAYHLESNGDMLVAFDVTVALPGGVTATPQDVTRFVSLVYAIEFDGSAESVPAGARVDHRWSG